MLEVWGRRNGSNVAPVMWTVGELNLPHVRHDVGGSFGNIDNPRYLAMNPNAKIPTIVDDGFILWESNAIVRYLCERYGRGSLWPECHRERAIADQWMDWLKTTVYPDFIDLFWAIVRTEPALRNPNMIEARAVALSKSLQILEARLASHRYVAGNSLTMGDIPLGSAIHRYLQLHVDRPSLPNIAAWHQRLCERPGYQQHVTFQFGTKPAEWYLLERGLAPPDGGREVSQQGPLS